jgi:hypothetical protein
VAHEFSSAKIVSAAKVTPGEQYRQSDGQRWKALSPQQCSLASPTYHDLGAQTTTIEKQDSNQKKNLTRVRQR